MSSEVFCCIVPSQPPIFSSGFQQIDPLRWNHHVEGEKEIREVCFFITQPLANPEMGLSCYIAAPPFTDWRFIGAVTNESPSGIFRISWKPEDPVPTAVQLGVSVEPLAQVQANLAQHFPGQEFVHFGTGVATNLVNYLQSFPQIQGPVGEYLLSLFNQWLRSFEDKCKRDPFFWMKRS